MWMCVDACFQVGWITFRRTANDPDEPTDDVTPEGDATPDVLWIQKTRRVPRPCCNAAHRADTNSNNNACRKLSQRRE